MLQKIFKVLVLILAVLAAALFLLFKPKYASTVSYGGETTRIQRDANNIPTITAQSRIGYFYAVGRVHAEDRLFQMTMKRLVVQGRLSEYLGVVPLPMDKFMRQVNLDGWGSRMADRLQRQKPAAFEEYQGYVRGINDFVAELLVLPVDFQLIRYGWEDWTVADVMGQFKLLQWSQSMGLSDQYARSDLLADNYTKEQVERFLPNTKEHWAFGSTVAVDDSLIPQELTTQYLKKNQAEIPAFDPSIMKQFQELGLFDFFKTAEGSNQFVISGKHTASGQPILAHDPHLENVMPSQWYQLHVFYKNNGKQYSISGISCPGIPFIVGKTNYAVLGITTIHTDNQDLYREKIQGDKYLVNGKRIDLTIRKQVIKVKTADGVLEQVYTVKETHRGPIIHYVICSFGSYSFKDDLSLRWTGYNDEYSPLLATSSLPQISSLQELKKFVLNETEYLFNVNVAFMTRDGHIGYQQMGAYPIRANPESGLYIKDGTNTHHDWRGFVPHYHRLQVLDPQSGYIVSANNRIASNNYYNGIHQFTIFTARSDRLHQLISEGIAKGRKFTIDDAKKIVADTVDVYCLQMQPYLKATIPQTASQLTGFDCDFKAESTQAAMYEIFVYQLHHLIKPHKTQKMSVLTMHPNAQYVFNYIKQALKEKEKVATLRKAWTKMKQTLTDFFKTGNSSAWQWGKIHQDAMHHLPFSNSSIGFLYDRSSDGSGNMHTVNVGKMNKVEFGNFETSHRANYRAVYSFVGDSYWIIDSGISEKFFSRHYDDQWQLFRRNEFLPIRPHVYVDGDASAEL